MASPDNEMRRMMREAAARRAAAVDQAASCAVPSSEPAEPIAEPSPMPDIDAVNAELGGGAGVNVDGYDDGPVVNAYGQGRPDEVQLVSQSPRENRERRVVPFVAPEQQMRTLPHSVEAEMGVLGSVLNEPTIVTPLVEMIGPAHFYVPAHQTIYDVALELIHKKGTVDLLILTDRLRDLGQLDAVGGPAALTALLTFVPSAVNWRYYAETVAEKHALRQVIATTTEYQRRAYEEQDGPLELITEFKTQVGYLALSSGNRKSTLTVRTAKEIWAMEFDDTDNFLADRILAAGQACTLLGPGGVGKSRLSMQLAICMITGRRFLDLETHARGKKWLFIQTENNNRRLAHDLEKIAISLRLSDEEAVLVDKHLFIHTIENENDAFLNLVDPVSYGTIHALIQDVKPDFVQWDPLNSFTDADLNSDMDMRAVVSAISRVTRAGNPNRVPVVLHHSLTGKAGAARAVGWDKASYGRNSKVLQAWTRAQINLSPRDPDDPNLLIMSCGKNNNGKPFPEIGLIFDEVMGLYRKDENFDPEGFRESVGLVAAGKATRYTAKFNTETVLGLMDNAAYGASQLQKFVENETGMKRARFYEIWAEMKHAGMVRLQAGSGGKWVKT